MERCDSWGALMTCRRVDDPDDPEPELGSCGGYELHFTFGLEATPSPPWPWISDRLFFSPRPKKKRKIERRRVANIRLERFLGIYEERHVWKIRKYLKKFRHPSKFRYPVDSRLTACALGYVWVLWANFPADARALWDQWLRAAREGPCVPWERLHPPIPVPPLGGVHRSR